MTGKFARSIQGHDKGTLYVIVEKGDNKIYVSDGKYKLVNNPKGKNIKHLQIIDKRVDDNTIAAIIAENPNANHFIRCAIKQEEKNV